MDCEKAQENLSAHLDGELGDAEEKALKAHIEECPKCRSELESLRLTVKLLQSLPRAHAPATFKQRILESAEHSRPVFRFRKVVPLLTAAALVLVSLVAVFMLRPTRQLPDATTPMAEKETLHRPKAEAEEPRVAKKAGLSDTDSRKSEDKLGREINKLEPAALVEKLAKGRAAEPGESLGMDKEPMMKQTARRARPPSEPLAEKSAEGVKKLEEALEKRKSDSGFSGQAQEGKKDGGRLADLPKKKMLKKAKEQALREDRDEEGEGVSELGAATPEARIEEYVIETDDMKKTLEEVETLLARYLDRDKADKPAQEPGAARAAGGGAPDESVVLIVQVDSKEYKELISRLQALEGPRAAGAPESFREDARQKKKKQPETDGKKRQEKEGVERSAASGKGPQSPSPPADPSLDREKKEKDSKAGRGAAEPKSEESKDRLPGAGADERARKASPPQRSGKAEEAQKDESEDDAQKSPPRPMPGKAPGAAKPQAPSATQRAEQEKAETAGARADKPIELRIKIRRRPRPAPHPEKK